MVKKIKFFIFFVIMGLCAFSYAQNTHPKLDALERLFEKVLSLEIDVDHYESGTVSGILKLSAWNELSDFINQDEDASLFNELRSSLQEWGRLFDAYAELHDEAIDLVEKVDAAGDAFNRKRDSYKTTWNRMIGNWDPTTDMVFGDKPELRRLFNEYDRLKTRYEGLELRVLDAKSRVQDFTRDLNRTIRKLQDRRERIREALKKRLGSFLESVESVQKIGEAVSKEVEFSDTALLEQEVLAGVSAEVVAILILKDGDGQSVALTEANAERVANLVTDVLQRNYGEKTTDFSLNLDQVRLALSMRPTLTFHNGAAFIKTVCSMALEKAK